MILARSALRDSLNSERIRILDDKGEEFPGFECPDYTDSLEPASIDLHIGNHWLLPCANTSDPMTGSRPKFDSRKLVEYREYFEDSWEIPAHGFILARTQEVLHISDDLAGWVEGRSSFGRFGTFVHNAGWIDPGFKGSITLEIYNALPYPAILYAGTPCCQIIFSEMLGDVEGGYQGSYQGQLGTKGSMLYKTVPGGVR